MSYILDALRRADSERERGAVPSIHAMPAPEVFADEEDGKAASPRRPQPLVWAVVGLAVLLLAVLAWQFMGKRDAPAVAPVAETAAVPAPMPTPATTPSPSLPEPSPQLPRAAAELPRGAAELPAMPAPQPVAAAPTVPRKPARPAEKTIAPASVAPAPAPLVVAYNDLPEDIRRELPQLLIGGAMYSQSAATRMLILNGQVFHEGDKVAGELVLEQIKLKSAVLGYKGHHFSITY